MVTSAKFNGPTANFKVIFDTYLTAAVPALETRYVTVATPFGTSSKKVYVTPKITSINPSSGPVGATVVIAGSGLGS